MRRIVSMLLILLLITGLALTGCGTTETNETPDEVLEEGTPAMEDGLEVALDVAELIESRCTTCHNLETAYKERPLDKWQEVIDRMVEQQGANLNDEEHEAVVEYLEDNYSQ